VGKKSSKSLVRSEFAALVTEIKGRIQTAQTRAVLTVNAELVHLYWDIGRIIHERQQRDGWGSAVIPRLVRQLHNELPELKGFSERNIGRMIAFYRSYPDPAVILPQPVAKLPELSNVPQLVAKLDDSLLWPVPWAHHVIIMEKVKDPQSEF
jgi:hypothetical protein